MKILNKIFNGNNSPSLIEGVANMTIQGGHKFASAFLSFLFIPVLFITFVATTAFADEPTSTSGYVCDPSQKTYISCNTGYVLSGTGPGNACIPVASCGAGYYKENDSCKSCSEETQGQYPLSRADDNEGKNKCYQTCDTRDIYHPEELPVGCYSETWCKKTDDNKYYVWDGTQNKCRKCNDGQYYSLNGTNEQCIGCPSGYTTDWTQTPVPTSDTMCSKSCTLNIDNATVTASAPTVSYPTKCGFTITYDQNYIPIKRAYTLTSKDCSDSREKILFNKSTVLDKSNQIVVQIIDDDVVNSITHNSQSYGNDISKIGCYEWSWTLSLKETSDDDPYYSNSKCAGDSCTILQQSGHDGYIIGDFTGSYGSYDEDNHLYTLTDAANNLISDNTPLTEIKPLELCPGGSWCKGLYSYTCPLKATTNGTGKTGKRDCIYWASPFTLTDKTNESSKHIKNGALFQMSPTMIDSILCADNSCN